MGRKTRRQKALCVCCASLLSSVWPNPVTSVTPRHRARPSGLPGGDGDSLPRHPPSPVAALPLRHFGVLPRPAGKSLFPAGATLRERRKFPATHQLGAPRFAAPLLEVSGQYLLIDVAQRLLFTRNVVQPVTWVGEETSACDRDTARLGRSTPAAVGNTPSSRNLSIHASSGARLRNCCLRKASVIGMARGCQSPRSRSSKSWSIAW